MAAMIGGLSSYAPGSFQSYGSAPPAIATAQSRANDGSAVCTALDCAEHGAFNLAQLQAKSPGLSVNAVQPAASFQARPLASGGTLLAAQQSGTPAGSSEKAASPDQLSEEEKAAVAKLKAIDAKVRAHERAHAAVGGQYAGAPSYSYTRGPDGQMYATSGEVSIDISAENDPEATLQKAAQVAAAALAPADPSGQDRAVAAAAQALRLEALAQIRAEKAAEQEAAQAEEAAPAPPVPGAAPESGQAASPGPETPPAPGRDAAAAYRQAANNILSALNRGGVFAAA